jgi:hypothetical protein
VIEIVGGILLLVGAYTGSRLTAALHHSKQLNADACARAQEAGRRLTSDDALDWNLQDLLGLGSRTRDWAQSPSIQAPPLGGRSV